MLRRLGGDEGASAFDTFASRRRFPDRYAINRVNPVLQRQEDFDGWIARSAFGQPGLNEADVGGQQRLKCSHQALHASD
jgi:hypothetical protein